MLACQHFEHVQLALNEPRALSLVAPDPQRA